MGRVGGVGHVGGVGMNPTRLTPPRYEALSEREREVFQLVAEGRSNKDVADLLSISVATVETHRAHILQKRARPT